MTCKLIILNTGENIIANNIKEAYKDDKLVCYILENPCQVVINGSYKILDEEDSSDRYSISLTLWPRLSKSTIVELFPDSVVTAVDPADSLRTLYETEILGSIKNEGDKTVDPNGQASSDHGN